MIYENSFDISLSFTFSPGCLESAVLLTEYIPFEEESHANNIMKSFELGYMLLKDLKSTAFTLRLREYLQHFGFHILNNQTVCIYPKLEPLVNLHLEQPVSVTGSSQVEYPLNEIKQILHCRLLAMIEKLFLWVRICYSFHLSQSIQCPQYTAGYECKGIGECQCPLQKLQIICKRPDSRCLHLHKPYTESMFDKAVVITLKLMMMDSELNRQVDKEDLALMVKLEGMLNKKNLFELSKLLLKILTPDAGNSLPLKTSRQFGLMKRSLVSQPRCAAFVRNHLFQTWKRVMYKSRKLPDFFLESQILIGLFNLKVFQRIWMNKLCIFNRSTLEAKALEKSVLISSKNMYVCIYQRFMDSLFYLHEKWDPLESLIKFTKYTALLLRKTIRHFPCWNILLFWCEYFFCTCNDVGHKK